MNELDNTCNITCGFHTIVKSARELKHHATFISTTEAHNFFTSTSYYTYQLQSTMKGQDTTTLCAVGGLIVGAATLSLSSNTVIKQMLQALSELEMEEIQSSAAIVSYL